MTTLHVVQPPAPVETSAEALSELVDDARVTFNNVHEDLLQVSAVLARVTKSVNAIIQIVGDVIEDLDSQING